MMTVSAKFTRHLCTNTCNTHKLSMLPSSTDHTHIHTHTHTTHTHSLPQGAGVPYTSRTGGVCPRD